MQIPILKGIYADENADFRNSYPINLEPVALDNGISAGYLRPAAGFAAFEEKENPAAGLQYKMGSLDRGSIVFDNKQIRIFGNDLCRVLEDGYIEQIAAFNFGVVGATAGIDQVSMDYSFDYLAIVNGGKLFIFDKDVTLTENTDPDLGVVLDVIYIDGYFMTTDGEFLVITELGNPLAVASDKYGSSEVDPDPIVGLLKVHNEVYALNRYTIEAFYNKGTGVFPFARIEGTRMNRGLVGVHAKCEFQGAIAFMGGGRHEPTSIWIGLNAQTQKIATREIDQILQSYTEEELKLTVFEKRIDKNHEQLWIRLIDKILVYDAKATEAAQIPVWFIRDIGPRNLIWFFDKWFAGNDEGQVAYLDDSLSTLWGEKVDWRFQTNIIFNESNGAIFNKLELIGLPGRVALGENPTVWTSYSLDGQVWSNEKMITLGTQGERMKRVAWFSQGFMENYRIQRFRGNSDSHFSIARLEAEIEGLAY